MMETHINLLPQQKKDRLNKLVKLLLLKNVLEWSVLTFAFLAIFILWGWMTLQMQFNSIAGSAMLIDRAKIADSDDIKSINKNSRDISSAGSDFTVITDKLLELINKMPANVKFTSVDIDRKTNSLILTGTALTRDALLAYQENLKSTSWVKNVESPVSQLFQKSNINFEFKAQLNGFVPLRSFLSEQAKPINTFSD